MEISTEHKMRSDAIIDLFAATFAASEGEEEGQLIGQLAKDMLMTVDEADIFVFSAVENDAVVGAIIFTRMSYDEDDRTVFILSPVAVAPTHQNKGIGQELLRHGLETLRTKGVDVALTYGNIEYYSKVGFAQISEAQAQPPVKLSYPHGWLAQSLSASDFESLKGASACVDALSNPAYW